MPEPGAETKTSGDPKLEYGALPSPESVAATPIAPGQAAGYDAMELALFPAAATTTTPLVSALVTASHSDCE